MNIVQDERVASTFRENNWRLDRGRPMRFEKDGYEIYFYKANDGYELTIRDPETGRRAGVLEFHPPDIRSPLSVALLVHLLEDAESVVSNANN